MRRLDIAVALAFAVACDDASADRDPSPGDGGPKADAGASLRCADPVQVSPPWALLRCEDGASFSIQFEGLPLFEAFRVGVVIGGETAQVEAWPEALWADVNEETWIQLYGNPALPDVTVLVRLDGGGPSVSVVLQPGEGTWLVDAVTVAGRVVGAGFAPTLPTTAARTFQGFAGADREVLAAFHPVRPGVVEGSPRADGLDLTLTWPVGRTVGGGLSYLSGGVQLRAGEDALALADSLVLPDFQSGPRLGFGWRTGGAYGLHVSAAALRTEVETLQARAAERGIEGTPAVLVEGLWYAALGDWRAGPGFPEGLAGALRGLGPVDLGVVWPAAWRGPAATDCGGPCPQMPEIMDLSLPSTQERVARDALALRDAGVDWAVWTALPAGEVAGLDGARGWLAPTLTDDPAAAEAVDGLSLGEPPVDPGGCLAAEWVAPRTAACDQPRDAPLVRPTGPLAASVDLLESWAHRSGRPLEAGGVRLGGSPGEGRISAVLNAATGGPYLLADAPSQLTLEQADLFFEVFSLQLAGLRPRGPLVAGRASRWESPDAYVVINWTDAEATVTLPARPALEGIPRRLTPGSAFESGAQVVVSPRDLVLFRR